LTTYSFGQKADLVCKEVKGVKSKITDNKNIGVMDTVLFLVRGQITKTKNVEDNQDLKGINVNLKNINGGQIIGASTEWKFSNLGRQRDLQFRGVVHWT
jgi:hypothetical protein